MAALVGLFAFCAGVACLPEWEFVYYPLDDAYYYLNTARHIAQTGEWSFDGGLSTTNGFHPLYMLFCVGVWRLFPSDPFTVARIILLANVAFGCVAGYYLYRVTARLTGNRLYAACVVLVGLCNTFALHMLTNLMESCLYLLVLAGALHNFCVAPLDGSPRRAVSRGVWLAVAVLARTEAILLVPLVVAQALWTKRDGRRRWRDWRTWHWRDAVIVGAVPTATALAFFTQSLAKTGCFFQMSGRIHQFYMASLPPIPAFLAHAKATAKAFSTCFHSFNAYTVAPDGNIRISTSALLVWPTAAVLLSYPLALFVPRLRRRLARTVPFALFLLATTSYYALVQMGEAHPRYQVTLLVCMLSLCPAAIHGWAVEGLRAVCRRLRLTALPTWPRWVAGAALAGVVAVHQVIPFVRPADPRIGFAQHMLFQCFRHRGTNKVPAEDMLKTAAFMRQHVPPDTVLAGFDCGCHAYYSGLRVSNLDGVINNQAALARIDKKLLDYVLRSRIEFIVQMQDHTLDYFDEGPGTLERAKRHIVQVARVPNTHFYGGFGIFKVIRDPERFEADRAAGRFQPIVDGKLNRERY